jgi:hypothetical protein
LRPGGQIKLVAPAKLFASPAVSETYSLPELALGAPVAVRGSVGGRLVVQLAYPVDVIFFERRDTPPVTEKLTSRVAEKGYVPRLNLNSARIPGEYNVIYAGDQVPLSALREVVGIVSSNGVRLRSIQPQRRLGNGIQNQIQVGSSATVACLDPIDQPTLHALTQAQSDQAFLATVDNLPKGNCTQ